MPNIGGYEFIILIVCCIGLLGLIGAAALVWFIRKDSGEEREP